MDANGEPAHSEQGDVSDHVSSDDEQPILPFDATDAYDAFERRGFPEEGERKISNDFDQSQTRIRWCNITSA